MTTIETTATVTEDGTLIVRIPVDLPPGAHRVVIEVDERAVSSVVPDIDATDFLHDFPKHDWGPWPEGLSLRREDMYNEWGR